MAWILPCIRERELLADALKPNRAQMFPKDFRVFIYLFFLPRTGAALKERDGPKIGQWNFFLTENWIFFLLELSKPVSCLFFQPSKRDGNGCRDISWLKVFVMAHVIQLFCRQGNYFSLLLLQAWCTGETFLQINIATLFQTVDVFFFFCDRLM